MITKDKDTDLRRFESDPPGYATCPYSSVSPIHSQPSSTQFEGEEHRTAVRSEVELALLSEEMPADEQLAFANGNIARAYLAGEIRLAEDAGDLKLARSIGEVNADMITELELEARR